MTGVQTCALPISPFNALRGTLFFGLLTAFLLAYSFFGGLFELTALSLPMLIALMPLLIFAIVFMLAMLHLVDHVIANSQSPVYPIKIRDRMKRRKGQ